ncbi:hypothetical protein [Clostridium sp. HBUAS56010]|uniref:DUF6414 family protein n=1 Tax=Clostridium sp. HBUAS56010 TaxID=2571127 RepID=UPI001178251C|nr:hypothetical protein [Clostridium sp. HBUAS56010]
MDKYKLDIPLYLNQKIVFDLLASVDDGFSKLSKIKTSSGISGEVEASVDAGLGNKNIFAFLNANVKGKTSGDKSEEKELEKIHTPSSLFNGLKESLYKNKMVKKIYSQQDFNKVNAGEFVEICGTLSKNPLISVLDNMANMIELMTAFSDNTGQKQKRKNLDDKQTISKIRNFSNGLKSNDMLDLICKSNNGDFKFQGVLPVYMDYFFNQNMNELIDGSFKVFGKVTKICSSDDEKINLLRNTSFTMIREKMLDDLFDNFNNLNDENFSIENVQTIIEAPSILIIPIAIYI